MGGRHRVETSTRLARLRREYLFGLAHLCHLTAPQVDDLTLTDFAAYTDDIDAYIAAQKRGTTSG